MNYTYSSSGGVRVVGGAIYRRRKFVYFAYTPGQTLFLAYKAKRGVLERITIKRIDVISNNQTGYLSTPLYVDNLNALYNESDLCTELEALDYAKYYYQWVLGSLDKLI